MRLTALCVCGTLLAFSSLSWITVEGVLLGEQGFGPCVATLRPDRTCRPGEHESTCPYLFSLPPLTVHLPQQLRELEKIMEDLQKLKDSVDELREMCADCKVSPSECATQRQREHENLSKGKGACEDEKSWMKVRLEENDRDVRRDCREDDIKVEKMEGDNDADERLILTEEDRKKWETDRRSDGGIIKEEERDETLTEKAEKETEGTPGSEQEHEKVPTAGANERITDVIRGKVVEKNHRPTASDKNKNDAEKRNAKEYQDHTKKSGGEAQMNTNVKKKEESHHHIKLIETKKTKEKTQTETSQRIKMPEHYGANTNKKQKQHKEEKREEKEEGIEMGKNNEKPKDGESIGKIEKERIIKEAELDEEGRQTGKEIKTEGDGELSSSKIIETTDFVSISPTLQSTVRLASRPESRDSNKATIFTSSLPSPLLPSSTLSLITDVGHDTRAVYGPTQSTDLGAAGISKPSSFEAELATTRATATAVGGPGGQITSEATRSDSASTVRPAAGRQGHVTTTPTSSATHEKLYITAVPRVTDRSRWTPKKNTSSRTTTVVKPLPGQGKRPGKKPKPGLKPEAKQTPNNPKNDRKPDHPLSPDKKTKYNPKQKPSTFKPKINIYKAGKDSEQIQNSKPDQRTPPNILVSNKNLKSNLTIKHYQDHKPGQNKTMIKKIESKKSPNPVQRPTGQKPQTGNITWSDRYPLINRAHESDEVTDQNSKTDKNSQTLKADQPKQKHTPDKKIQSEEKTKFHMFEVNKHPKPVQEPESKKGGTASFTPKPESVGKNEENTSPETKSNPDSTPGHKITPDRADQKPNSSQETPMIKQTTNPSQKTEFKISETATPKPNQKNLIVSVNTLHKSKSNPDSTPRPKMTPDGVTATTDQKTKSSQGMSATDQSPKPNQKSEFKRSETVTPEPNQKHLTELLDKSNENPTHKPKSNEDLLSRQTAAPDRVSASPDHNPEPTLNVPKNNQTLKLGQVPKPSQKHPKPSTSKGFKSKLDTNPKPEQTPQTNPSLKAPKPGQIPALKPISVTEKFPKAKSNKTSKPTPHSGYRQPTGPAVKSQGKPLQRPKPAVQPKIKLKTKTPPDPSHISRTTSHRIQNSHTDMPPASGLVKQIVDVTHSPAKDFSVSMRETITLGPKTSNSLETGPLPRLHALSEDFTLSPDSRILSDLRPQTDGQPPSIPVTTRPNKINRGILQSVIASTSPGSTPPRPVPKSEESVEETPPVTQVPPPSSKTTSTLSPDLRSKTSATSGPEPPAAESSTSSARELRVKINQVAAFLNNTLSPNVRPEDRHLKEHADGGSRPERTDGKLPTSVPSKERRDCSDHLLKGETKSGVYLVTPDHRSRSFQVFCDMELDGGGWTLLQRRQDGSVSFNRTWAEYQSGFGQLDGGEFWLGNNMIHLLTRDRDMVLRVELEDFGGVTEHAQYELFRVAGERLRYRLTVGAYSGTAGDALRFSKNYDHNSRPFTTPDRDNDRYPSGNCGAYYSSGWWFDACMAANLNGRYYKGTYKGVRDGIFWGTWHNISTEYYPTNDRQSFKTVRMMIRPKGFTP